MTDLSVPASPSGHSGQAPEPVSRLGHSASVLNACPCGKTLSRRNVTGLCLPCVNRRNATNPEYQARRLAALAAKWAEPAYREKMRLTGRAHALRLAADPEIQARRREMGKIAARHLHSPEIRARTMAAVREKSGPTQSASRIAWCPPEYRDLYWWLRKSKRLTLAECKEAIAAQQRADLASLSPFERQMRALQNGARVIANDPLPSGNQVVRQVG